MELIIEEISRGHKLLGRHKFIKNTIAIGRGYQNDIILDDPHICADHLSIEFDGEHWVINDTDSVNGSFVDNGKKPAHQHVIKSGDIISVGKSQIRVLFPDHPVKPSVAFNPFENLINFARKPLVLVASILLLAAVSGYLVYLDKPTEITFTQLLAPTIGMTLLFTLWPLLVTIISHLTKHDARIISQIGICFLFFNLMWFSDIIEGVISFNLSSNWPLMAFSLVLPVALSFGLFWFNCAIGFHMSERRKLVVASGLTLLLFGGVFVINLSNKPEFSALPTYNSALMPPSFLLTSGSDVETFINDSQALFEKTREKAQEADE